MPGSCALYGQSAARRANHAGEGWRTMSQVTKRALEQSLKNLLLKKPLTKITVADIAEDCGINRMTFYYHFKDIYDLVEWSCLEDAKRALDEKKTYDTWQQGLLQIFEAVQANKPFILNVYRCVHREQVEKYLQPLVDQLLLDVLEEEAKGPTVRDEDKQFIAQIYGYIFIGLMLDWIKDDMRSDPQPIVGRLAKLVKGSMSAALSRFSL
jgi:probable dihydroxyacetone kinase regulator